MTELTGIIANVKNGKFASVDKMPVRKFELALSKNRTWQLGIDPASRYTGLAVMSTDRSFIILLDVKRDTVASKEEYYRDLHTLIRKLVAGVTVERTVLEKPFTAGYSRASEVLIALRGKIEDWVHDIPELANSDFQKISPNSWKSRVINKSKGKGRFNAKGAIAEDLCDAFPVLREYYKVYHGGDLDSFDALGILIGYQLYAYTEDGSKQICGMKEKSHKSFVGYVWVDESEINGSFCQTVLGDMARCVKVEALSYNDNYSFAENVMMATSNYDVVMSLIPHEQLQAFQWKFGIDVSEPNKFLVMFAFRSGHFSVGEMNYLDKRFEMKEQFGGV